MRKNSIKNTRINGEVQKELSTIIRNEIKDPRIHVTMSKLIDDIAKKDQSHKQETDIDNFQDEEEI